MFTITKDHVTKARGLDDTGDHAVGVKVESMPLYGIEKAMGEDDSIPNEGATIPFRMYDDDGELYFEGELTDDDECRNQSAALRWGEADAGCTRIEVRRNGRWVQEIA